MKFIALLYSFSWLPIIFLRFIVSYLCLSHLFQKEEFQHTAYATNAYVTIGPLSKYVLHGKVLDFLNLWNFLSFKILNSITLMF